MESQSPKAIEVRDLRKVFVQGFWRKRPVEILKGISLSVRAGASFGFLGPNGAGKTTTIKTLIGLIAPTSGAVNVLGAAPSVAATRARVGYLPENPSFPDHLTGREVLEFTADLLRIGGAGRKAQIDGVLAQVRIAHAARLQVRKYSKGMVQRLGIAQAILHDPELVILDEPMSGLDPIGRREVKDLILELRNRGRTVFFSTHIIADVDDVCDEAAIVIGGEIVRAGPVASLMAGERTDFEIVARQAEGAAASPSAEVRGENVVYRVPDEAAARELISKLWSSGARVLSMNSRSYGLEKVFMEEVAKRPAAQRLQD